MADAEKLAAAKKRFEELKKKKGKKAGGKPASPSSSSSSHTPPPEIVPKKVEGPERSSTPQATEDELAPAPDPASEPPKAVSPSPPPPTSSPTPSAHARTASIQARRASASHYRRPSINATDILRSANKSLLSPTDVPDIYYRQAETISNLTEENEKLAGDVERLKTKEKRLGEIEAEKDRLQEQLAEVREELRGVKGRIDAAEEGKKKSEEEMEKMRSELEALNRQTSHFLSQITAKDKTISELRLASSGSSTSQDRESLSAKEDQIENMEIDLNKLRSELERAQKTLSAAEESLKAKEYAYDALQGQLSSAQKGLDSATAKSSEDSARHSTLESQLRSVQKDLEVARGDIKKKNAAISTLDKDHYTLKTMYRDAESKSQEAAHTAIIKAREVQDLEDALAEAKRKAGQMEAECEDLRIKLERTVAENRKLTGGGGGDDDGVDELEDAERRRLRERIRTLELQLEQQQQQQKAVQPTLQQLHGHPPVTQTRQTRGMSMLSEGSFLSDDADFGEMMKREMTTQRQREEAAAEERRRLEMERLERIREVKRGLEKWRGWRMDLTLVGGSPHGLGEMFEI